MNIKARERMYGSDPLTRRALEHRDKLKRLGVCAWPWPNRKAAEDPDHPSHRCERYKGHGSVCRCACGATRRRP